ncbi:PREDICTED: protein lin-37 homolog isoform X2 [Cyphomyrmex costatus]|uniref:Protein lin-37 like protein n=1 Tax=Cyphomyrmex costatus TaxID=456900 RepID=A0A195C4S2_9HYME|nr:PREDICTED: protein lin-37 homolog isoform X2 [Cyphomyrmex costatus]KYM95176.1 Protein lin-37 like protein [Cyphomyrmex costatus]
MGKKRNIQSSPIMPGRIKIEIKNEIGDNDVLVARDRLKGALRELLHHNDSGSSAESDDSPISDYKHPTKKMTKSMNVQRRIRRRRPIQTDTVFHHTYVMKLFDRSVDLAQFQEDTPLYPICRAWMANQPRNPHLAPKVRSPSPEIINEVNTENNLIGTDGELNDVHYLPPPLPCEEAIPRNRVPSPILEEKDDLNLDYEGQSLKTREQLMKDHIERWNAIRKKWHQQTHKNEQRYLQSATILGTIFTKFV